MLNRQLLAAPLPQPARDLHRTDIIALTVVSASLGNQDPIPFLQSSNRAYSLDELRQMPLGSGEQDRERCERHVQGRIRSGLHEYLRVRNDETGPAT
ncbi:hypothetical protein D1872_274360 [compost metagenome]